MTYEQREDSFIEVSESIRRVLEGVVRRVLPGTVLLGVKSLEADAGDTNGVTAKGIGYGSIWKLRVKTSDARERHLVFHTARPDAFGHDRRADRAAEMLLAYDDFRRIPNHTQALDVGAIAADGTDLVSLAGTGEFYLLTSWVEGHLYAEELRSIAERGSLEEGDVRHSIELAQWLIRIHAEKYQNTVGYKRSLRDVFGSGEGIFGIIDSYPVDHSSFSARLQQIEELCLKWRWRLRPLEHRHARIHGDFHPFNVVFDDNGNVTLLDASRGCEGDPANDVAAMAINFMFFALERPHAWENAFRKLWYTFWQSYLDAAGDPELLEVVAPYFAWRGLVLACPLWYPHLTPTSRERMLSLIEQVLRAPCFDPEMVEETMS